VACCSGCNYEKHDFTAHEYQALLLTKWRKKSEESTSSTSLERRRVQFVEHWWDFMERSRIRNSVDEVVTKPSRRKLLEAQKIELAKMHAIPGRDRQRYRG
jgi:hypothetical protein